MFLWCTIAPAGAYQWNRPGRQRINQLQRICMAYDQVRAQAHAFLSHIKRSVDNCRQFAFKRKRMNRKFWNILYLDTPLFFIFHSCVDIYTYLGEKYHVSGNVLSEKSTTMTSRRRFARHSVCSTGRASRYIYYLLLSTIYREGHGFITVPDITHVLQTLGEKLAPDETQVQLLRRRRRCCYTSQPN